MSSHSPAAGFLNGVTVVALSARKHAGLPRVFLLVHRCRGQNELNLKVAMRIYPCKAHKRLERQQLCAGDFAANTSSNPPMRKDFIANLRAGQKVRFVELHEVRGPGGAQSLCAFEHVLLGRVRQQHTAAPHVHVCMCARRPPLPLPLLRRRRGLRAVLAAGCRWACDSMCMF